jgi:hypothetical protein
MEEQAKEILLKFLRGERITRREFELGKKFKVFSAAKSFEDLDALWYEDDEKKGYLCTRNGKLWDGKMVEPPIGEVRCMFGIHLQDVKPEYLKPEQKKFLP